jgi:hypothetical protein
MKNVFVHRRDLNNPGDLYSSPFHYLDKNHLGFLVDYSDLSTLSGWDFDNVVIGGGGMTEKFVSMLEPFFQQQTIKNLILWGVGWKVDNPKLDWLAQRATLVGIREWLPNTPYEHSWVPCASVLNPCIEQNVSTLPTKNFLIIDHWKRNQIQFNGPEHTRITNRSNNITSIIETIADHRWVITSSYHSAYWAILLNKRVIFVSDPWMAKCETLKYAIPSSEQFSWDLLDQTQKYPDAYEECRQVNLDFKQKFLDLLG